MTTMNSVCAVILSSLNQAYNLNSSHKLVNILFLPRYRNETECQEALDFVFHHEYVPPKAPEVRGIL